MNDVIVNITDQTRPLTQAGFGKPLILGDTEVIDGAKDTYKEYTELSGVAADYGEATNEYKAAQAIFSQEPRPETIAILNVTRAAEPIPADLTDALNTLVTSDNDWYFLILTSRVSADIQAVGGWVDANGKLFGISMGSSDESILVAAITTVAANLVSDRCFMLAHQDPTKFPDSAWVGKMAPKEPGSATWKFKSLVGIPDGGYNTTDIAALHAGNVNTYVKKHGLLQTTDGKTTAGSYIDITRSKDWIKARMQEAVMAVLVNNEKVSYDNSGITLIVDAVKSVLKSAVTQGIIARDDDGNGIFTITSPKRADIPVADRASRKLPDIKWDATIAGAVHAVEIDGVVRV